MINMYILQENNYVKIIRSVNYNYNFNKHTGLFIRWGKNEADDPILAPFGPEILDLEISTSVKKEDVDKYPVDRLSEFGGCMSSCGFCYKSNRYSLPVYNMTLAEFKIILNKMPDTLTQIAFGIMNIITNPDFFSMMSHAKSKGVIPNFTCHGLDCMTLNIAKQIASFCGAVAISLYDKDKSYNTVKMLTDAGMTQVNIHYMLSQETYKEAFNVIDDFKNDLRLKNLNALVFLSLKRKGGGIKYTPLNFKQFCTLMTYADKNKIIYGIDSCTAHKYIKYMEEIKKDMSMMPFVEPCESSLMSSYINARGEFYACSFAEGESKLWKEGLSVLNCNNFLKDIWYHERTKTFRDNLLKCNRTCPLFVV